MRHVVDPDTPTVDGAELTDEQRTELTLERIKRQKRFRVGVLGTGLIDKKRALEEVRDLTAIGRALIDVEHRAIRLLREYLAQHPAAAPRRRASTTSRTRRIASRAGVTKRRPSTARHKKRR